MLLLCITYLLWKQDERTTNMTFLNTEQFNVLKKNYDFVQGFSNLITFKPHIYSKPNNYSKRLQKWAAVYTM